MKNFCGQNAHKITDRNVCEKFDEIEKWCHNTKQLREMYQLERKIFMMFEKKIRLTDTEEVRDFVRAAEQCNFDINVCYNREVIDAKSIMGVLYLGLSKDLIVTYGEENAGFEHVISKYAVA